MKIGSGATPRGGKEVYKNEGIPFIRSQNVYNNFFSFDGLAFIDENQAQKLENVKVGENDVLLNITGDSVCRCTIVPKSLEGARVNQHVAIIRSDESKLNHFFLKSVLVNIDIQKYMLSLAQSGGTRAALTKSMIENLEIPLPKINEQLAIVDVLKKIDDKIELNNAINKNLEQIAQALFKRWFIDFEFPNENGEPYKSSGGEFEESELGLIPKGWIVSNIYEVAEISMGQSPKSEFYNNIGDGLPFHQGVTNYGIRFPKNNQFSSQLLRVAKKGSILISVRAPVGRLNIANCDMVIGRGLGAINSKTENNSYLFYSLKIIFAREDQYGSGTIFNSVTKKELENIKIVYPIARVINQYEKVAKFIDKQIFNLSNEIDSLVNLRDTLLPKLMSGELRVPLEEDAEATI